MSNAYLKCPSCGEDKLACLDEHEWTRIDSKLEISRELHRKLKCVSCLYESDECKKYKYEILSLLAKAVSAEDLRSVSMCEELERDKTICFAIILHGIRTRAWEYVIEHAKKFQHDMSFAHIKPTFLTLEACCQYFAGEPDVAKDIIRSGQISFDLSEKAQQFAFELVRFLLGELLPPVDVNDWLGENWFRDFKSPYSTFSGSAVLGLFETALPADVPKELFRSEEILKAVIAPLLFHLIKITTDKSKWPNDSIVFLQHVCTTIIPTDENLDSDQADNGWYREIKRNLN
ncbi:MAG: hypothetical protein AAB209_05570, partial [Bacteroidota bacterium]